MATVSSVLPLPLAPYARTSTPPASSALAFCACAEPVAIQTDSSTRTRRGMGLFCICALSFRCACTYADIRTTRAHQHHEKDRFPGWPRLKYWPHAATEYDGSLVFSGVEKYCIVNWLCQHVPATTC